MKDLKHIKKKPLYIQVADELKEYIISNNLGVGDRLPTEHDLVKILGVGRSTVREGIRYLQTLGIIDTTNKSGISVKEYSLKPISEYLIFSYKHSKITWRELIEARRLLEIDAIELAVNNITEDNLEKIKEIIETSERKNKLKEPIVDEDYLFHQELFKATNNLIIEQYSAIIREFFYKKPNRNVVDAEKDAASIADHKDIYQSLKERDKDKAIKSMDLHISRIFKQDYAVKYIQEE